MKEKLLIVTLIIVFGALIAAMQDAFFLAGGSDAGEVIVLPSKASQWGGLLLFSFSMLLSVKSLSIEKRLAISLKTFLLLISIIFLLASGHSYRYSDRAHALVDTWYFIPLQTLEIDFDDTMVTSKYCTGTFFVYLSIENQSRQMIFTGPGPFGISQAQVVDLLQSFGIGMNTKTF